MCAELDALCIYVSTDYVFDGEKTQPYTEEDPPRPINVYGTSKLAGEYLVRQTCPRWTIVRVASLFGNSGARAKGGNFIDSILAQAKSGSRLRVVNDTRISPTYALDAALAIVHLAQQATSGIVHVTNSGFCTWYELAKKVTELCRFEVSIEPVSSDAFPRRAARPRNSALNNTWAEKVIGAPVPAWEDALDRYLRCKGHIG
jgi:dTDP-4-dehydrorhamnose reductase